MTTAQAAAGRVAGPSGLSVPAGSRHDDVVGELLGDLLDEARCAVAAAGRSPGVGERYARACLAARCAGAALLAARAPDGGPSRRRPGGGRATPPGLWDLLAAHAPEMGEWAAFFAVAAQRVEGRAGGGLCARAADDLTRQAELFIDLVCRAVGVPVPPPRGEVLVPAVRA